MSWWIALKDRDYIDCVFETKEKMSGGDAPLQRPKGVKVVCGGCGNSIWANQTMKETTQNGGRNPYYLKWWAKCGQCEWKHNWDDKPEEGCCVSTPASTRPAATKGVILLGQSENGTPLQNSSQYKPVTALLDDLKEQTHSDNVKMSITLDRIEKNSLDIKDKLEAIHTILLNRLGVDPQSNKVTGPVKHVDVPLPTSFAVEFKKPEIPTPIKPTPPTNDYDLFQEWRQSHLQKLGNLAQPTYQAGDDQPSRCNPAHNGIIQMSPAMQRAAMDDEN